MDWTTCVAFSPAAQQLTGAASEQTSSHLLTWGGREGEEGGRGEREGGRGGREGEEGGRERREGEEGGGREGGGREGEEGGRE